MKDDSCRVCCDGQENREVELPVDKLLQGGCITCLQSLFSCCQPAVSPSGAVR